MFKRLFRGKRHERDSVDDAAYELVPHAEPEAGRGFVIRRASDGRLIPWRELAELGDDISAFQVAGVTHHSEALQESAFAPGALLQLVPESDNPHDPNAVAVWDIDAKHHVGYVPRERAPEIKRALRTGERLLCLSMWEVLEGERRVALRALVVGDSVSLRSAR